MVLYFIGLGLGDKEDITMKGLKAIKNSKHVFLEHYTAILCDTTKEELEEYYGCKIILADREMVEQESYKILDAAKKEDTSFLVVGDPLCATTHTDLLIRAAYEQNIEVKIVHNASIMNAVACCGLQLYHFGATVSIPFWTNKWKPDSFYDKIKKNIENQFHTLCLLDIKVKEISEENLIKGINKYEKPRFMSINTCIKQLLQIGQTKKEQILTPNTKAIALARVGHDTQIIAYGAMKQLLLYDFGKPLHSLVIPASIHFLEEEVLQMYKIENLITKQSLLNNNIQPQQQDDHLDLRLDFEIENDECDAHDCQNDAENDDYLSNDEIKIDL